MVMRHLAHRTPDECGNCGATDFERLSFGHVDSGLYGGGLRWEVMCRQCRRRWMALGFGHDGHDPNGVLDWVDVTE